jgi:hypothetical protein
MIGQNSLPPQIRDVLQREAMINNMGTVDWTAYRFARFVSSTPGTATMSVNSLTHQFADHVRGTADPHLLQQTMSSEGPAPFYATATPEEWEQKFREWTDSHPEGGSVLPSEAYEREAIYEDDL